MPPVQLPLSAGSHARVPCSKQAQESEYVPYLQKQSPAGTVKEAALAFKAKPEDSPLVQVQEGSKWVTYWYIRLYSKEWNAEAFKQKLLLNYKMQVAGEAPQGAIKGKRVIKVKFTSQSKDVMCSKQFSEIPEATRRELNPDMSFFSEAFANQKVNTIKLPGVGQQELIEMSVMGTAEPEAVRQKKDIPRVMVFCGRTHTFKRWRSGW